MSKFRELISKGRCGNCGRIQDRENKTICTICNSKRKNEYLNKKNKQKCFKCGKPARNIHCKKCQSKIAEKTKQKSLLKICIYCEKDATHGVYCEIHHKKTRDAIRNRLEQGKCLRCGNNKLSTCNYCWICWLKGHTDRTGTSPKELENIWNQQQGKCTYSGRLLIPGKNAHLDHKISVKNKGTNDPNNLQWVDKNINYAKRALSEDEFLTMIRDIYEYKINDKKTNI